MTEGFICDFEMYVSNDPEAMGKPVVKGSLLNTIEEQTFKFDLMDDGFNVTGRKTGKYIRFVALSGHGESKEAAIAMLEVLTV